MPHRSPICCIVPEDLLCRLADSPQHRARALRTLILTERLRGRRVVLERMIGHATSPGQKQRTVYDAQHTTNLPGKLVRSEGQAASSDVAVNEAYDFCGATYDFYTNAYNRNSIDDKGMRLDSSVHYDQEYDNAFWDGQQMVYGDGDGTIFERFTKCIDVVGHELTHGVTAATANLDYQDQPGALNESISDVFGSLVKQMNNNQTADQADWLIGEGLFLPSVNGVALRSMKAPGTAYDDPQLGKDPQPADMAHYVNTRSDQGGVHTNSGIPNHAFYLVATELGGFAWERAGRIWYEALTKRLTSSSNFQDAADNTFAAAGDLYGVGSDEQKAVQNGWHGVGIKVNTAAAGKKPVR